MLPQNFAQMSAREQAKLGLPEGFKLFTPAHFDGMNQSDSRVGMPDADLFYMENLIHIGGYNLRGLWDVGAALYTASGKTIISFFFFSIGATAYTAIFFSDGTAVQVDMAGDVTGISSVAGTFYTSGASFPACAQWGAQYLIIANNITPNSYWVWDGMLLYGVGSLSPLVTITAGGEFYVSTPMITAYGGTGSGFTAKAIVNQGNVIGVQITNPGIGYNPIDVVQLAFSGGGGSTSAILQAVLSPVGIAQVVISNAGLGYTPGTYALTFTGGGGTGAAGTYTVDSTGGVVSTNITNAGSNYTGNPKVTFTHGGGTGALGYVLLTPTTVASITAPTGGNNYQSTPTLTFVGGGAITEATATANLTAGAITSATLNTAGVGYTSTPAIIVESGLNYAAAATVSLMPFGVSGNSMETFQSRVWLAFPHQSGTQVNGGSFNVSAPGSFSDFATSDGGLFFTSTDSFLRYQYTNIKQSNGYLYPFGDSSVSVISNVQTSGSPPSTTFNYQNTDPQVGTVWRDSCVDFSRTILFGNPLGAWGLYGGAVTKISKKLDSLFTNGIFPPAGGLTPSSVVANVFSRRIFAMLMTFEDPFTLQTVNKMVCWDEKDWFIASQTPNLTYIGTQEINSDLTAWGTDGTSLYPLFSAPSNLPKKLSTKLYGINAPVIKEQAYAFAIMAQDVSEAQSGVTFNVNIDTNYLNPNTNAYTYPLPAISFSAPVPTYPIFVTSSVEDVYGMNVGATVTTTSEDFTINFLGLGYVDETAELALAGG